MATIRGASTEVQCQQCQKVFRVRMAELARGWGRYCSRACKCEAMIGKPRNKPLTTPHLKGKLQEH